MEQERKHYMMGIIASSLISQQEGTEANIEKNNDKIKSLELLHEQQKNGDLNSDITKIWDLLAGVTIGDALENLHLAVEEAKNEERLEEIIKVNEWFQELALDQDKPIKLDDMLSLFAVLFDSIKQ